LKERSSKHQAPTSREAPNFKLQNIVGYVQHFGDLELEISLELGGWCLELQKIRISA
jgi:hypothetical protein